MSNSPFTSPYSIDYDRTANENKKLSIRCHWQIVDGTAKTDESCACCGYPFDPDEHVFVVADGMGEVYCSLSCADRRERGKSKSMGTGQY